MRVAACAPAASSAPESLRAALARSLFGFETSTAAPSPKAHSGAVRVKGTAARRVHQQQGVKSAPGHARQRIRAARKHHVRLARLDHSAAVAIASAPEEHAVATAMLGPKRPNSLAIRSTSETHS